MQIIYKTQFLPVREQSVSVAKTNQLNYNSVFVSVDPARR